jgi:urease accessory protein
VLEAGSWPADRATDEVLIDFDRRFRRRFVLHALSGAHILLDLPQAVRLREGDGLVLEDGGIVLVRARAERLLEIAAADAARMMRIAWHLGNRHLPVQFVDGRIRIREDHVIAEMVAGLGGQVTAIAAAFDPEAGAYAGGHQHLGDEEAHDHAH